MGTMNGLKAFAVALVLFTLAFGGGFPLLFRLAYAVLALVFLGLLWTRSNLLGLDLRREIRAQRAQVGQTVEERFTLHNRLLIPKLWLEVRDHSTLPEHRASRAFALGPWGRKAWTVRTRCRRRGKYSLGPTTVASGDPFGLFRMRRRWGDVLSLVVYPATVDLPYFTIPLGQLPGGNALRQRSPHITPNSLGIRPYVPGDGLSRIHWPSTARLGSLTVKEFELDPLSDIWVVLDGQRSAQAGSGDEGTEEYGVTIAASLAKHFLDQHRAVGLIVYGSHHCVLPADRGSRQFLKMMEELAVIRAVGRMPLAEVLSAESLRFGSNTTLVVVTPSLAEDWVVTLRHESRRGVRGVAVFLEPATFGGSDSSVLIVGALAAAQLPTFLVKRGDDLAKTLSTSANGRAF